MKSPPIRPIHTGSSSPLIDEPNTPIPASNVPRRAHSLTSKTHTLSSQTPASKGLSRSASRSKGISLNLAVSPVTVGGQSSHVSSSQNTISTPHFPQHKRAHSTQPSPSLPRVNETSSNHQASEFKYDIPLPQMDQLVALEMDEQLRLLALKEMCIVEIKDSIANLNTKLDHHEKELHKLREVIQKSLYRELNGSGSVTSKHQRQSSNPRDEAIASTKMGGRRRTLSSSYGSQPGPTQEPASTASASVPSQPHNSLHPPSTDQRNSKIWSNLAKPLNILQQFDTMLQNEFERSLISTPQQQNQQQTSIDQSSGSTQYKSRNSEDSISSYGSVQSPLKAKSKTRPISDIDLDKDFPPPPSELYIAEEQERKQRSKFPSHTNASRNTEDMLQTVSSSIWSFVNDVKSNVLSSLSEEDVRKGPGIASSLTSSGSNSRTTMNPLYNLETGSTINLHDDDESNGNTLVYSQDDKTGNLINNSDYEDLLEPKASDEDDEIDFSMYSSLRKK